MNATRLPCLDSLRGIAALGVVLFHFGIFYLPQAGLPSLVYHAYLAVDLFFLLSGFVMAHVYGRMLASNWRANWMHYARARFARIYPLFALTTVIMLLAVTLSNLPLQSVSFSGGSLALEPVLLQQWASGLSWNYPSWSISTEAEAYVVFIFFAGVLLDGKYPRLLAVCCFGVIATLSIVGSGSLNFFVGIFAFLRTLAEFSLGVLLYRAHSNSVKFPRMWAIIFVVALVGLSKIAHQDFFLVGAFGCLIYYCAGATGMFGKLLNARPFSVLGNWSYGIYLWHAPSHYAVMAIFIAIGHPVSDLDKLSSRLLLLATVILVVGVAALNYRYFETPLRRLIVSGVIRTGAGNY